MQLKSLLSTIFLALCIGNISAQCIPAAPATVAGTMNCALGNTQTFTGVATGQVIQLDVPAGNVRLNIDMCATNPGVNVPSGTNDSYLTLLDLNDPNATPLGALDDGCLNMAAPGYGPSIGLFDLANTGTYFIYLTEYNGNDACIADGVNNAYAITLEVVAIPAPPANDECVGAMSVPVAPTAVSCTATTVNTVGATQSLEAVSCSATWYDDDVWYTFTTPATLPDSLIILGTPGTVNNFGMAVYDACGGNELACFSGGTGLFLLAADLLPNTTYTLRCWAAGTGPASQGTYDICIYGADVPMMPVMSFSTDEVHAFSEVGIAGISNPVTMTNTGGVDLVVNGVSFSSPQFTSSLQAGDAVTALGGTFDFTVEYTADDLVDDAASMTINTNAGDLIVGLKGYGYGQGWWWESNEDNIPANWINVDADGDTYSWFDYPVQPYTGLQCFASASWLSGPGPLTPDNYLILPQMTPRPGLNTLSFFVAAQDPDFPDERYSVVLSTGDSSLASFTNVLFDETLVDVTWREVRIDLSAYNNQNVWIAFRHFGVTDEYYLKIDDVRYPDFLPVGVNPAHAYSQPLLALPNPNNGTFSLKWDQQTTDARVEILDMQGKMVQSFVPNTAGQAEVRLPVAGMYVVQVTTNMGVQTTRVTVK